MSPKKRVFLVLSACIALFLVVAPVSAATDDGFVGGYHSPPPPSGIIQDSDDGGNAESFESYQGHGGNVTNMHLFVDLNNASTRIILGIYTQNTDGTPNSLVGSCIVTTVTNNAWNSCAIANGGVTLSPTASYQMAILSPAGYGTVKFHDTDQAIGFGRSYSFGSSLATFPATATGTTLYHNAPLVGYGGTSPTAGGGG